VEETVAIRYGEGEGEKRTKTERSVPARRTGGEQGSTKTEERVLSNILFKGQGEIF